MERVKKQTKRLSKSVHPRNIPSARMGLSPTTPIDATTRECCFPDCAGPSTAIAVPLPNSTSHVTMSPTTPEKPARRGRKSMSRRSEQSGSIQKEGNWYVVLGNGTAKAVLGPAQSGKQHSLVVASIGVVGDRPI